MKSQLFFTRLIKWTFCFYWPSFFQVVGNLKSSNRKLAFSWLQMSGLQTFQKFDKTALRCLLQYCVFNACILELSWSDTYFKNVLFLLQILTCQDQKSVSNQGNIFPRDIFKLKLSWGGRGPLLSFIFNLYSFISFLFFDFQSFLVHLSFKTLSLKTIFCRLVIDSFSATHPNITSFWRFGQNSIISPETPASDQTNTSPSSPLRKSLKRKSNKYLSPLL